MSKKDVARRVATAIEFARSATENFNKAAITFLLTELDAAITFCKICRLALASSSDHAKIENELGHVEHALASALRTKKHVTLKAHERQQFREKVQQLEALVTLLAVRVRGPRIKRIERCLSHFRG